MTLFRKVEVYRSSDLKWRYRVVAPNGEIVGDSGQGYASRRGARRAVRREYPDATVVLLPDNWHDPRAEGDWPEDPDTQWGVANDPHADYRE